MPFSVPLVLGTLLVIAVCIALLAPIYPYVWADVVVMLVVLMFRAVVVAVPRMYRRPRHNIYVTGAMIAAGVVVVPQVCTRSELSQ